MVYFACAVAHAQLYSPVDRMVFQRGLQGGAGVPIYGRAPVGTDRVEAQAVVLQGGVGVTSYTPISTSIDQGFFQGTLPLQGGWYSLRVRAMKGTVSLAEWQVAHVGVGEVFIVAGQSNALGGISSNTYATDDRVSCVNQSAGENVDLTGLNGLTFSQMAQGTVMAPKNPIGVYGLLGDRLAARLNVPILFLGAAVRSTSSNDWRATALGQDAITYRGLSQSSPFRALEMAIRYYGRRTGVRAVLWHQGESDNGYQTMEGYVDNLTQTIKVSRTLGLPNLAWAVSLVSYEPFQTPVTDSHITDAQQAVIKSTPNVFLGAQTDGDRDISIRPDQLHFFGDKGYDVLANRWLDALTTTFFAQCQPSLSVPLGIAMGPVAPSFPMVGQSMSIFFNSPASGQVHTAELLAENGTVLQTLGTGTMPGFPIVLPALPTNQAYRVRVSLPGSGLATEASPAFRVNDTRRQPQMLGGMSTQFISSTTSTTLLLRGVDQVNN